MEDPPIPGEPFVSLSDAKEVALKALSAGRGTAYLTIEEARIEIARRKLAEHERDLLKLEIEQKLTHEIDHNRTVTLLLFGEGFEVTANAAVAERLQAAAAKAQSRADAVRYAEDRLRDAKEAAAQAPFELGAIAIDRPRAADSTFPAAATGNT